MKACYTTPLYSRSGYFIHQIFLVILLSSSWCFVTVAAALMKARYATCGECNRSASLLIPVQYYCNADHNVFTVLSFLSSLFVVFLVCLQAVLRSCEGLNNPPVENFTRTMLRNCQVVKCEAAIDFSSKTTEKYEIDPHKFKNFLPFFF